MIKKLMVLNGVAILCVVISHAFGWGQIALVEWADRYPPASSLVTSITFYVYITIRQLLIFCVPVFLIVSGFFISYATRGKDRTNSWKIIRSRILTLLVPYTIWSIIIWISDYFINHIQFSLLEYVLIFLGPGVDPSYYYIPLIIYLYLLSLILMPWAERGAKKILIETALVSLSPILIKYISLFFPGSPVFEFLNPLSPFWALQRWIFYFALGICLGLNLERVKVFIEKYRKVITLLTVLFAIICVIEPEIIMQATGEYMRLGPLTLSSAVYSIGFTFSFLLWWTDQSSLKKPLSWLGGKAYGIYLVHQQSMEFIGRIAYHFFPWMLGIPILYLPVLLIFGLGVPVVIIIGLTRSPARKSYSYLFG